MLYAEVLINRKVEALDHGFTYEIPPELFDEIHVGSVVSVPFGAQTVKGIVLSITDDPGDITPKYIDSLVNESFIFPEDLLELANYLGEYYMNPKMSVLRAMIPRGVNLFGKALKAKTESYYTLAPWAEISGLRSEKQKVIVEYLSEYSEISLSEALNEQGFSQSSLQNLVKKGILLKQQRPVRRGRYTVNLNTPNGFILTDEQRNVLHAIRNRSENDKRPILLHGVTGSGKTEVYLRLVADAMAKGKQSIVLMPEIALTPQFISVFEQRFTGKVVLMHSRLSAGERRDAWYAARYGEASVILGARSAVFAPVCNLGLIVMDEEHEESYYQSNTPRFHAREAAAKRCEMAGALFVMGSATPSFESYKKAKDGTVQLLSMAHRVNERPLPKVKIVDMRDELRAGWTDVLSRPLLEAIGKNLEQKKQTVLFLNRLGSHTFVSCRDCGFVHTCPDCGISLIYYEGKKTLHCNHCDYEIEMKQACPQCGSYRIRYFGLGTEGLEKAVRKNFPQAGIDRLDSDSTKHKGDFDRIYQRMKSSETDILIGTKMVTKGWDFPNLTLIGVIAADLTLNFPDFRSGERAFQTITQVAGRCGRSNEVGQVILQTYRPNDPVIRGGSHQDYATYYEWESEKRAGYGYPPFTHEGKIVLSAPRSYLFQHELDRIHEKLEETVSRDTLVLGPAPAVYRYRKEMEKWVVTLVNKKLSVLRNEIKEGLRRLKVENILDKNIVVQVELDPLDII
ncbi:MAG: primosomal protein N' [Bacillota bacterium]|nr:primosomal protein N' [Bacillota bacterium]